MRILKRHDILKLVTTFVFITMTLATHSKAAFAATTAVCSPSNVIVAVPGTGLDTNCTIAITLNGPIPVTELSFSSLFNISDQPVPVVGTNIFTFTVVVTDLRNTTEGWRLQASSPGLSTTNSPDLLPLTVGISGASTATCTPTAAPPPANTTLSANTDCPPPVIAQKTLDTTDLTPVTFVTETPDITNTVTNPISGVAHLTIAGSYELSAGTYPGAYAGAITLSLVDTST